MQKRVVSLWFPRLASDRHLRMRASSRLRVESSGSDLALISYDVFKPKRVAGSAAMEEAAAVVGAAGDD